jgi:O-antigen ligase
MEAIKNKIYFNTYSRLLGVLIFLFCFAPKSIGLSSFLFLAFTIFLFIKKKLTFQFERIKFILFLIYVAYLIGVLFSNNLDLAFKYLEYKLVLLLFPLLFSYSFKNSLNIKPIVIGLILGLIITSILCLINSYTVYLETKNFHTSFGSVRFSYIHHPSYFSSFLVIGNAFFYFGFKQRWPYFSLFSFVLFTLFSVVMQFFCFSLAGMLFLLIVIIFISIRYVFLNTKTLYFYSVLLLVPIPLFFIYRSNDHLKIEIDNVTESLSNFLTNPNKILTKNESEITGNDARLIMWTVTLEEITKHPFGVGTGDVDYFLTKRLQAYNLKEFANRNYNPHNQFLQMTLELGLIVLFLFLLFFYYSIKFALKHKNWILLILILNLFFNCLFESMLQRQSGIVFYVFFTLVLIASTKQVSLNDSKK